MKIGTSDVLQLGEPTLRQPCRPIANIDKPAFRKQEKALHAALVDFRKTFGFGRSIAAPQLGIDLRFLAMNLGQGPLTMVNPVIAWRSPETFTMFDDCMSFPSLFVRLTRNASITVDFRDGDGRAQTWKHLDRPTSELLQHEIDHLDGVLAVDRATTIRDIITRESFDRNRAAMSKLVDYTIPPLSNRAQT
ncbi:MAG TPA: peptide deformylase [Candidatus Thermoplasmatota archaeon]|nr:peptide deformylase [Candidatus Thermoplasmatota archaeon]